MMILKTLVTLFYEFFKTGLFAVGGGLATVPFLREIAERYTWFTTDMLSDMIAVSESTPGPIGVNMATYAGYSAGYSAGIAMGTPMGIFMGILGGIIATLGLIAPSIIIILLVSGAYKKFKTNPLVQNAFYTIRPAVTGMIAAVAVTLIWAALFTGDFVPDLSGLKELVNIRALVLFILLLIAVNVKKIKKLHPIVFIVIAGICGAIFKM